MDDFCGSEFWNSSLSWHTNDPRLTPCFELTALVWAPCIFLWILAPFELYYIRQTITRQITWHTFNIAKFAVAGVMLFISVLDMVVSFSVTTSSEIYPVHHVAPFVRSLTFGLLIWFMYFNKTQGIISSGTQFMFSLLLFICAIPRVKTISDFFQEQVSSDETSFWVNYDANSTMALFAFMTIYLIMQCFADKDTLKVRNKQQSRNAKPSPEETASFLRRITFQWFDPIIYAGYKRPLTKDDMYQLNSSLEVHTVEPLFTKYFEENVEKNRRKLAKHPNEDQTPNGSVLPALIRSLGGPFFFAGFLKFLCDILTFVSPQLLSRLIHFASSDEETWKGYFYTVGLFVTAVVSAFLNCQYSYYTYVVGFNVRSVLVSSIYRKALRTTTYNKKDGTVGQIVNLMAIDAQRFYELSPYLHFVWSGPFVIGLSIYFLWQELGPSVLAGLAVLILFVPFNGFVATKIKGFMVKQMQHKDERLKFMNEILSGIKVIKLYAWERCFQTIVERVRAKELKLLWTAARWDVVTYFGWGLAPFLVALASFSTFVMIDANNVLDASKAFVSISLFNILRMPMALFPMMISMSMQAWVSINRINVYLNSAELDTENVSHEENKNAITVKDGTFSWGSDAILSKINLDVPRGKLWAIVGTIGSGKSSLISAILGEMEKVSGSVNTDGSIAYVPQVAWIQNATFQDNILFGQEMKRSHYKQVIDACALRTDIEILSGGDQTEIGEKGINLSGGQKQRISLARAVYRKSEIYLFDDPLSAVDAHVGKHIFENIIGPDGVLNKTTRILVTHALSYLPFVDNIVVLQNGKISEIGSYSELMKQKGPFAELVQEQVVQQRQESEHDNDDQSEDDLSESYSMEKMPLKHSMSIKSTSSAKSSHHLSNLSLQEKELKKTKLVEAEEAAVGKVGLNVYFTYFKNTGLHFVCISLLTNALQQGLSVYTNIWLSRWASDDEAYLPENRNKYLGIYGAVGAGQGICNLIGSMMLAFGCLAAAKTVHAKLLSQVLLFPMSFFDKTPLGRIVNRFSKDIDTVDNVLAQSMRGFLVIFCSTIAILIVISIATPIFMAVVVPIIIVYYLLQQFYLATSRQLKRIESVTRSPIYSHFSETITGQTVVRAFSDQERFIKDSERKLNLNQACLYPSLIANRWLQIRLEFIGAVVVLFAALFATIGRGSITGAIVGLSISYSLQITQTLNFLVRMTTDIETNIVSVERIDEYTKLEQEPYYDGKAMESEWPKEGRIKFEDLSVSYKTGGDLVLKKISFDVNAKEKIGIVGRTGAGKSSLTLSLFRIIEASGGCIEIDDTDIAKISLYSLRSHLTIIPQDPVMFSGTLRMNVDPYEAYSDLEIWEALEHSHLKAFVADLPAGLNYILTEGGENLSVGQRQLICLARALLRKTKILVLDEATAAVDLETDSIIQKTIQTEFKDCTVLTIAHRINTILDSDRIIVLDKGMVAEYDTPENLMSNQLSIFYGMAKDSGLIRETSQL